MKQMFEITVDIQKETNHTDIKFSQNSLNTSELNINIANGGKEFTLLDSDKIIVYFKKPDQKVVFQDKQIEVIDKAKGKINVLLTTQTLIQAGKVYGEISIEREEDGVKKRINTYDFSFEVRSSFSANESIESTNEFQVFDKILETGKVLKDVNVPALIESEKVATEAKEATVQLTNQIGILSRNKANADVPLQFQTYAGDNQATHPKALYFDLGWKGYKFWMAYTPYPAGNVRFENPCIAVSNDGVRWETPPGLVNPITDAPVGSPDTGFNSDTHLLLVGSTLEIWYRTVDLVNNKVKINRKTSIDGVNWSAEETMIETNKSTKDYLSPVLIVEDGKYKMWYVNTNRSIGYGESVDGKTWTNEKVVPIDFGELLPWHLDMIQTEKGYEFIITAHEAGKTNNDASLFYTVSTDNNQFTKPMVVVTPNASSTWDSRGIYRSSFLMVNGLYYMYYAGVAYNDFRGIGLSIGEDITNLSGMRINFAKDLNVPGQINLPYGSVLSSNYLLLKSKEAYEACLRFRNSTMIKLVKNFSSTELIGLEIDKLRLSKAGVGSAEFVASDIKYLGKIINSDSPTKTAGLQLSHIVFDDYVANNITGVDIGGSVRWNASLKQHQFHNGTRWVSLNDAVTMVEKTTAQSLTSGTQTIVNYENKVEDTENYFQNQIEYIAQVSGKYRFTVATQVQGLNDGDILDIYLLKNGSTKTYINRVTTRGGNFQSANSCILKLNANDKVNVAVLFTGTSTTAKITQYGAMSYMQVEKI